MREDECSPFFGSCRWGRVRQVKTLRRYFNCLTGYAVRSTRPQRYKSKGYISNLTRRAFCRSRARRRLLLPLPWQQRTCGHTFRPVFPKSPRVVSIWSGSIDAFPVVQVAQSPNPLPRKSDEFRRTGVSNRCEFRERNNVCQNTWTELLPKEVSPNAFPHAGWCGSGLKSGPHADLGSA